MFGAVVLRTTETAVSSANSNYGRHGGCVISPLNTGPGDGAFDRVLHGEFSHVVDHLVVKIRVGRPSV